MDTEQSKPSGEGKLLGPTTHVNPLPPEYQPQPIPYPAPLHMNQGYGYSPASHVVVAQPLTVGESMNKQVR